MQKLFLFILTFLYVVGFVPNTGLGLFADFVPIICGLLIVWGLFSNSLALPELAKPMAIAFWLFAAYVLLVGIPLNYIYYRGTWDLLTIINFVKPVRILLTFYGGVALFGIYVRRYDDYQLPLFKNIMICLGINCLLIVLQTTVPGVNSIFHTLFYTHISETHFQVEQRAGGLLYSGGAMASAISGLALPFLAFLYSRGKSNTLMTVTLFIIASAAIVMTGRTGILFIGVYFLMIFLLINKNEWGKCFQQLGVGVFLVVVICIGYGFLKQASQSSESEMLQSNIRRLERLVNPYSFTEGAGYQTGKYLLSTFIIPEGAIEILFGNIGFSVHKYQGSITDMGYNRSIWLYGFFGASIYYLPFIFLMSSALRYKFLGKRRTFYLIFFIIYLVLELKENTIYSRNLFNVVVLLALCMYEDVAREFWAYSEEYDYAQQGDLEHLDNYER